MEPIHAVFRSHPELEPTGKLSLMGEASCNADRLHAYASRRNPRAPKIAEAYLRLGQRYGIRGDVAYCQAAYDTRFWTSESAGPDWAPMERDRWEDEAAIEKRLQMLYAFAMSLPLVKGISSGALDRHLAYIEQAGWQGAAPCWEDLNGKWSHPGHTRYGQYIVAMWRGMLEWKGQGEIAARPSYRQEAFPVASAPERRAGAIDWSALTNEQLAWLQERLLLPVPAPHPDRKVTWAELGALLRQWEKRPSAGTIEENKTSS
jgi:hypothetical protein